mmetsp:Transcript_30543/g.60035  ORF Transcript_30543/g.60035 Transcript_30543/m.60035 type:complete len:119 (-) Transcript_30543:660-1016(-)
MTFPSFPFSMKKEGEKGDLTRREERREEKRREEREWLVDSVWPESSRRDRREKEKVDQQKRERERPHAEKLRRRPQRWCMLNGRAQKRENNREGERETEGSKKKKKKEDRREVRRDGG